MISKIDFIHKDNITAGTVAASYTNVYDFEYPTQKFNEDFDWFSTSPSSSKFKLILDDWLLDNIYRAAENELTNYSDYIVRVYDNGVLILTGIMRHDDISVNVDDLTFNSVVNDFLILLTGLDDIKFDFYADNDFKIEEVTVSRENFLNEYAHDPYNLLKIISTISAQKYFFPTPLTTIELSSVIDYKVVIDDYVSLYKDTLYHLKIDRNEPDNDWYGVGTSIYNSDGTPAGGQYQLIHYIENVRLAIKDWYDSFAKNVANYSMDDNGYLYYIIKSDTEKTNIYKIDLYKVPLNIIGTLSTIFDTEINFTSKTTIPYKDYLPGCSSLVNPVMFYSLAGEQSSRTYARQTIFKKSYEYNKLIFWIIDIACYVFSDDPTDNPVVPYASWKSVLSTRVEKRVFIDYSEMFDEYELITHYFQDDYPTSVKPVYDDILATHFSETEIPELVYASPTYNWIDSAGSYANPVFDGTTTITIGDNLYTFELIIDSWTTHYQSNCRTLKVLYTGRTASIYLNYINNITASDVFRILTTIHNCSYRFRDTEFEVSDKDYLSQSSFIPENNSLIELERTQVRADELDLDALDKVITNDLKLYKAVVSNYYKDFFDLVRFKIKFTISTIFTAHTILIGSKITYDGKDYTICSVTKLFENIYEVIAFNGLDSYMQFSDDGITFADAELSDDGINFEKWNVRSI